MNKDISVDIDGSVATVEIRRPPANFFDADLLRRVADAAEELQAGGTRVLVLCSEGRHFCAGANFGSGAFQDERVAAGKEVYVQGLRLLGLDIPLVAAVQGSAVGGGLGLACAADFRVASPATRFAANFSALGFHHGFALSITLPWIVGGQRALDLLVTARRLDGTEAYAVGLVDRLVDPGAEREGALDLARLIAAQAPLAVRAIKRTQRVAIAAQAKKALAHELTEQERLWQTEDSAIGIAASLARQTPVFIGR
jgi:enoyl-CoA hydratase/carnithine racemase